MSGVASAAAPMRRHRRTMRLWPMLAGAAFGVAILWALGLFALRGWAPPRERYPVQGITIGADQGPVDWAMVRAAHADFAYLRAVAGDEADPQFAANWAGAQAAGLRYGAVLAFSLCRPAAAQATRYLATVPRDAAALPPVIHLAFTPDCAARPGRDSLLSALNTLLNLVETHGGKPAVLHVAPDFDAAYDVGGGINRTLWLDRDFLPPDYAARAWVMWSATRHRHVAGIATPVEWAVVRP
jgi:lysozyme